MRYGGFTYKLILMKLRELNKRIINFLLYSLETVETVPFLGQITVVALYSVGFSFITVSLLNIHLVFSNGFTLSTIILGIFIVIGLLGIVLFWRTRSVALTRFIYAFGVVLLLIEQTVDAGGVYGLGVFYFLFGFPVIYLFFGLRFSAIAMLVYCAAFALRMVIGAFPPLSIYNQDMVAARALVVMAFAAVIEVVVCACYDRIIAHLSRQAFYDPVSGMPNRLKIENALRCDIDCHRTCRFDFSVIAIKVLNLNRVNTLLGTEGCDAILRETGSRLSSFGLETRIVGRWSSSLFVLVADLHELQETEAFAESVLERLSAHYSVNGRSISVRFALAVSRYPEDSHSGNSIVDNAITLLDSGSAQSGEIRFFSEETLRLQQYRYSIIENLGNADFDRAFRLVYQPKVNIADRRCTGAEALIRWHDDQFGEVSPGVFIPMAEQSGLIRKITRWVVRRCVADALAIRERESELAKDLVLSVNLSVADLRDKGLMDFLSREVLSIPGMARTIEIEITEGIMLDEDVMVKRNLACLQEAGFRIAIDDFGTGYSSLSYLHKIRVNALKIDQSFIMNLFARDAADETPVIDAIISMSKSLGLQITAEGVETEAQLAWLASNGCDTAQGFLFSPGVPVAEFIELVRNNQYGFPKPARRKAAVVLDQ